MIVGALVLPEPAAFKHWLVERLDTLGEWARQRHLRNVAPSGGSYGPPIVEAKG